jgi:hypothetical protein
MFEELVDINGRLVPRFQKTTTHEPGKT